MLPHREKNDTQILKNRYISGNNTFFEIFERLVRFSNVLRRAGGSLTETLSKATLLQLPLQNRNYSGTIYKYLFAILQIIRYNNNEERVVFLRNIAPASNLMKSLFYKLKFVLNMLF